MDTETFNDLSPKDLAKPVAADVYWLRMILHQLQYADGAYEFPSIAKAICDIQDMIAKSIGDTP